MSIEIKRHPGHVRRQRYEWHHDRIGRLHAPGGYTYTLLGAWAQSVRERLAIRFDQWRQETFAEKAWRLP